FSQVGAVQRIGPADGQGHAVEHEGSLLRELLENVERASTRVEEVLRDRLEEVDFGRLRAGEHRKVHRAEPDSDTQILPPRRGARHVARRPRKTTRGAAGRPAVAASGLLLGGSRFLLLRSLLERNGAAALALARVLARAGVLHRLGGAAAVALAGVL